MRSSGNRSARSQAVGAAQMRYEIVRWKDGVERLCETVFFDSLGAFLYVDFFHGLNRNYLPRKCENCHRWFLLAAGKYSSCCNRPLKNEPGKTCRDVGSRKRYDDKCKNDPIWLAYNRAYKTHYARYLKKKMTTVQFLSSGRDMRWSCGRERRPVRWNWRTIRGNCGFDNFLLNL